MGAAVLTAVAVAGCSNPMTPEPPPPISGVGVLVGAGDIASCGPGAEATAQLLDQIGGTVFAAGDLAYPDGSARDFADCYEPTWGRHKDRTRPVPGNHEYFSLGARPYFDYFGDIAGTPGQGYYAYRVESWRVFALNSEISMAAGSAQYQWLRSELASQPSPCALAYWHRPLVHLWPESPERRHAGHVSAPARIRHRDRH